MWPKGGSRIGAAERSLLFSLRKPRFSLGEKGARRKDARLSTGYGRGTRRQPRLRVTMSRTSGDSDGMEAMRLSIVSA